MQEVNNLVRDQAVSFFLPAMISMLAFKLRYKGRFLSSAERKVIVIQSL